MAPRSGDKKAIYLIKKIVTSAYEINHIAIKLLRHKENFHDEVLEEMMEREAAKHS